MARPKPPDKCSLRHRKNWVSFDRQPLKKSLFAFIAADLFLVEEKLLIECATSFIGKFACGLVICLRKSFRGKYNHLTWIDKWWPNKDALNSTSFLFFTSRFVQVHLVFRKTETLGGYSAWCSCSYAPYPPKIIYSFSFFFLVKQNIKA